MRLVGLLREDLDATVLVRRRRLGLARRALRHVAEQLLRALEQTVTDLAPDAEHHARRVVPAVEIRRERVAGRAAHGLLAADDVPAERLVAVEQLLVHTADVVARRVEVHVHLLDDHAFLAIDLLGVEARVAQHVREHVERDVAMLGGALDVVRGVLLAGERVELAADRVDLAGDVACARPPLRPLEEHVLGEMRDAVRVRRLVARACGEHDHARHRLRLLDRRGQDPQSVVEDIVLIRAQRSTSFASGLE